MSPCVVYSGFGVVEQVDTRLMPLQTTPGKEQWELRHSLEGHQKKPRCHLSCHWGAMEVHTLPKEDTPSHPQCTDSIRQTKEALFLEMSFPGEHRTNHFLSRRLPLWPVLAEAEEGRARLFLPVPSTPLGKGKSPILGFIYSEIKLNNAFDWSPYIDLCHSPIASFRITCIIISLQLSLGINLNLGFGLVGWASELNFLSFLTDLWRILNSHLFEKSWL